MRRARIRTTVNLAAAQNGRRRAKNPETKEPVNNEPSRNIDESMCNSDATEKSEVNQTLIDTHRTNIVEKSSSEDQNTQNSNSVSSKTAEAKVLDEIQPDTSGNHDLQNVLSSSSREITECTNLSVESSVKVKRLKSNDIDQTIRNENIGDTAFSKNMLESVHPHKINETTKKSETDLEDQKVHKETPTHLKTADSTTLSEMQSIVSQPSTTFLSSQSTGLRLGRSRFRPNLSVESTQRNRLRRMSGSLGGSSEIIGYPLSHGASRPRRMRTISNSSATSETDIASPLPVVQSSCTAENLKRQFTVPSSPQR